MSDIAVSHLVLLCLIAALLLSGCANPAPRWDAYRLGFQNLHQDQCPLMGCRRHDP